MAPGSGISQEIVAPFTAPRTGVLEDDGKETEDTEEGLHRRESTVLPAA
jgi:hypothetical protein